jgi:hypothetical protein
MCTRACNEGAQNRKSFRLCLSNALSFCRRLFNIRISICARRASPVYDSRAGRDVVDKRRIESVSHIEIRIVHAVSMAVVNRRRAAKAEPQSELEFIASIYALRYIQR